MKMGLPLFLLFIFSLNTVVFGDTQDVVYHPAPQKPLYINEDWYLALKKTLPAPPSKASERQKNDEKELFQFQKARTAEDCNRAKSEILVSLNNFFGVPHGPLKQSETEALTLFFDQVRNDGDFFIQKLKKDFPRPRPFLYLKNLTPCVSREVTGAYPSGHAVLSTLFALILSDLYPGHKSEFEVRAKQIADDRVLSGMHHRSDIEAGQALAVLVYVELKKSEKYQLDFKALQSQLTSVK